MTSISSSSGGASGFTMGRGIDEPMLEREDVERKIGADVLASMHMDSDGRSDPIKIDDSKGGIIV
jgi:hypothetical protein